MKIQHTEASFLAFSSKRNKSSSAVSELKEHMKLRSVNTCNCRLCKTFIPFVGMAVTTVSTDKSKKYLLLHVLPTPATVTHP